MCFGSLAFVIVFVNPDDNLYLSMALFYSSLFFGCVGLFSLIIFSIRRRVSNNEVLYANVGISFRQAVLLSFILCINLALQQFEELTILKAGAVILVFFVVELFFHFLGNKK